MSDELDEIRKKRLAELQKQNVSQQDLAKMQQEQEAAATMERQKQAILLKILTEDARARLSNLKLVKNEFVNSVENQLIHLYQNGRLSSQVTEQQLLQMLRQFQGTKRESQIKFKRR